MTTLLSGSEGAMAKALAFFGAALAFFGVAEASPSASGDLRFRA